MEKDPILIKARDSRFRIVSEDFYKKLIHISEIEELIKEVKTEADKAADIKKSFGQGKQQAYSHIYFKLKALIEYGKDRE